MNTPFFSVIIPVFNAELYIEDCISSVLSQTFDNFELIIINDGSTDKTNSICTQFLQQDNRVSLINQENKGVSASRNAGIYKSKGLYTIFIDADDYIAKERLQEFYNNSNKTGTDVLVTGFTKINSVTLQPIKTLSFSPKDVFLDYIRGNWSVIWRLCIGSNYLKSIFFNESISYGEDYLFTCQVLSSANSIKYISTTIASDYQYRINNSLSLMSKQSLSHVVEQCEATKFLEEYLLTTDTTNTDVKVALNARKNWCRMLLFSQSITLFDMKDHLLLRFIKKIYRFCLRKLFSETKEKR